MFILFILSKTIISHIRTGLTRFTRLKKKNPVNLVNLVQNLHFTYSEMINKI